MVICYIFWGIGVCFFLTGNFLLFFVVFFCCQHIDYGIEKVVLTCGSLPCFRILKTAVFRQRRDFCGKAWHICTSKRNADRKNRRCDILIACKHIVSRFTFRFGHKRAAYTLIGKFAKNCDVRKQFLAFLSYDDQHFLPDIKQGACQLSKIL